MSALNIMPEFNKFLVKDTKQPAAKEEGFEYNLKSHETDFSNWLSMGNKVPHNPKPRFKSDDDLWQIYHN